MASERTLSQPLTDEDFQNLKAALEQNADLVRALNKAQQAGIDMKERLADANASRSRIQSLINTYFPGRY